MNAVIIIQIVVAFETLSITFDLLVGEVGLARAPGTRRPLALSSDNRFFIHANNMVRVDGCLSSVTLDVNCSCSCFYPQSGVIRQITTDCTPNFL